MSSSRVMLDARERAWLALIASGAAAPLRGFHGAADYRRILDRGEPWPVPFVLAVRPELAEVDTIELFDSGARPIGVVRVSDVFVRDPDEEARAIHGTWDADHPAMRYLRARPRTLVGGTIETEARPDPLPAQLAARGWRTVAAFDPGELVLRGDEDLLLRALATVDGVVLHPQRGIGLALAEVLAAQLPEDRVIVAPFPVPTLHAGSREVVLHALLRKNLGISSLVSRDRAGAGTLSASRARAIVRAGGALPVELVRPEVASVLRAHWLADVQEAA